MDAIKLPRSSSLKLILIMKVRFKVNFGQKKSQGAALTYKPRFVKVGGHDNDFRLLDTESSLHTIVRDSPRTFTCRVYFSVL